MDSQGWRSANSRERPYGLPMKTSHGANRASQLEGNLKSRITQRPPVTRASLPFWITWSNSGTNEMARVEIIPSTPAGNWNEAASLCTSSTFDQPLLSTRFRAWASIASVISVPMIFPSAPTACRNNGKFKPVPQPISTTVSPLCRLSACTAFFQYACNLNPIR